MRTCGALLGLVISRLHEHRDRVVELLFVLVRVMAMAISSVVWLDPCLPWLMPFPLRQVFLLTAVVDIPLSFRV